MILQKKTYKLTLLACFCILMFCSYFQVSSEAESFGKNANILVLNTNSEIKKYKTAYNEFKKKIPYPISSINLNEEKWKLDNIKSMLDNKKFELIYCIGTQAYKLANKYAPNKNIVFSSVMNWMRLPQTKSTYGVSNELNPKMQIIMLRYIFPDIRKLGILYTREFTGEWFDKARQHAQEMGIDVTGINVADKDKVLVSLKEILGEIQMFWLISDPVLLSDKKTLFSIFKICHKERKSILSYHNAYAKYGAALIISPDESTIGRQAAMIAIDLIRKKKINDKVQFPVGTKIILNLKTVINYGIKYNEEMLGTINEVIQ